MFVCICNRVSEEQIQELLAQGMSKDELIEITKIGTGCGTCLDYLDDIEERDNGHS